MCACLPRALIRVLSQCFDLIYMFVRGVALIEISKQALMRIEHVLSDSILAQGGGFSCVKCIRHPKWVSVLPVLIESFSLFNVFIFSSSNFITLFVFASYWHLEYTFPWRTILALTKWLLSI